MIYFEVEGRGYAVEAADLAGVAVSCPTVSYPSLPAGVSGLVQWSGRIFPVVDVFDRGAEYAGCTFLFSADGLGHDDLALAVPGKIRVYFPALSQPAPDKVPEHVVRILKDRDGVEAMQLSLEEISKVVGVVVNKGAKRAA